jgi:hypothetical protein
VDGWNAAKIHDMEDFSTIEYEAVCRLIDNL